MWKEFVTIQRKKEDQAVHKVRTEVHVFHPQESLNQLSAVTVGINK